MHEMLHKAHGHAHKAKPGSPAAILMKGHAGHKHHEEKHDAHGHREHHSFGETVGKMGQAAKNLAGSYAKDTLPGRVYSAAKDAGLKRGGNPHKAKKECHGGSYAHGGSVMDTMHGMGAPTRNRDIEDTYHGRSSTGAKALAAGGVGKTRKEYPFT